MSEGPELAANPPSSASPGRDPAPVPREPTARSTSDAAEPAAEVEVPAKERTPAAFLDRDGTLIRDLSHGSEPALMRLLPGVIESLSALASAGYRLVVVTNQSGVARGLFDAAESRAMGRRLAALLAPAGIHLSGYYLAPNHPAGQIPALAHSGTPRKPDPGLLTRAAEDLAIDLSRSWMIGDMLTDLQAGLRAGCRAILLDTGALAYPGPADLPPDLAHPRARLARALPHAAAILLSEDGHLPPSTAPDDEPPLDCRSIPVDRLLGRPPPADRRGPGQPSPWPDAARLARAVEDGRLLAAALAREPVAAPSVETPPTESG